MKAGNLSGDVKKAAGRRHLKIYSAEEKFHWFRQKWKQKYAIGCCG
jgi:hypothetical protein